MEQSPRLTRKEGEKAQSSRGQSTEAQRGQAPSEGQADGSEEGMPGLEQSSDQVYRVGSVLSQLPDSAISELKCMPTGSQLILLRERPHTPVQELLLHPLQ